MQILVKEVGAKTAMLKDKKQLFCLVNNYTKQFIY